MLGKEIFPFVSSDFHDSLTVIMDVPILVLCEREITFLYLFWNGLKGPGEHPHHLHTLQ